MRTDREAGAGITAQPELVAMATERLSGASSLPGLGPTKARREAKGAAQQGINQGVLCP